MPEWPVPPGVESRSLSPSGCLSGREGFVSTVTRSSDSGIGEGTLLFRDPSPLRRLGLGGGGEPSLSDRRGPSQAEWLVVTCFSSGLMAVAGVGFGPQEGPKVGFGAPRFWTLLSRV